MQKLILASLLFSFLLSACDGDRNIDVADRERRLGVPDGNSPEGGKKEEEASIYNFRASEVQIFEADKKIIFTLHLGIRRNGTYVDRSSIILVDLQTTLFYLHKPAGMEVIGSIECTSSKNPLCRTFKMREALTTFFPDVDVPSLNNRPLELSGSISVGEFELQKKVDDIWTTVGGMATFVSNTDYGSVSGPAPAPFVYYAFPGATVSDNVTWVYPFHGGNYHAIPFYDPVPNHRLIEMTVDTEKSEISFLATYLNVSNAQTLTQQYRVEHVQK